MASPVHMIELKLASVKEVSRHRVTLINPYSAYTSVQGGGLTAGRSATRQYRGGGV